VDEKAPDDRKGRWALPRRRQRDHLEPLRRLAIGKVADGDRIGTSAR